MAIRFLAYLKVFVSQSVCNSYYPLGTAPLCSITLLLLYMDSAISLSVYVAVVVSKLIVDIQDERAQILIHIPPV